MIEEITMDDKFEKLIRQIQNSYDFKDLDFNDISGLEDVDTTDEDFLYKLSYKQLIHIYHAIL
jgi:hypothetical protein